MANSNPDRDGAGSDYARYLSVGFTFVLTLGLLATGGFFLDRWLGTLPLFLLLGLLLGFIGGLYYVYQILRRMGDS